MAVCIGKNIHYQLFESAGRGKLVIGVSFASVRTAGSRVAQSFAAKAKKGQAYRRKTGSIPISSRSIDALFDAYGPTVLAKMLTNGYVIIDIDRR